MGGEDGGCLSLHFSLCLCKTGNELYVCVCVGGRGVAYLPISPSEYVRLAMSCMCVCVWGGGGLPISPFLPLNM